MFSRNPLPVKLTKQMKPTPTQEPMQYFEFYSQILNDLTPSIRPQIEKMKIPIVENTASCVQNGPVCAIIGLIYKKMANQPLALDEFDPKRRKTRCTKEDLSEGCLVDSSDTVFIEDCAARLELCGRVNPDKLVTGMAVGVIGRKIGSMFEVSESLIHPGLPYQVPRTKVPDGNRFVCLISGLEIGTKPNMNRDVMFDWIAGFTGDNQSSSETSARIKRTIIAGNTFKFDAPEERWDGEVKRKRLNIPESSILQNVDAMLCQLASSVSVDLMSGVTDPAEYFIPQPAMKRVLFPMAKQADFRTLSNPFQFNVDGLRILGTSGQIVESVKRYSKVSTTEAMELILKTQNIAPCAPENNAVYPFKESSPLLLNECPHVFFAGNQPEFSREQHTGPNGEEVLLLGIPSFTSTSDVVLLNIDTLETQVVSFSS